MDTYVVYCGRTYAGYYIKEIFNSLEGAKDYYWENYKLDKSEWSYDEMSDRYFYDADISPESSKLLLEKNHWWYDSFYIIHKVLKQG